jgi:hypothetical protein
MKDLARGSVKNHSKLVRENHCCTFLCLHDPSSDGSKNSSCPNGRSGSPGDHMGKVFSVARCLPTIQGSPAVSNVVTRFCEYCNEKQIASGAKVCELLFAKQIRQEANFCSISELCSPHSRKSPLILKFTPYPYTVEREGASARHSLLVTCKRSHSTRYAYPPGFAEGISGSRIAHSPSVISEG